MTRPALSLRGIVRAAVGLAAAAVAGGILLGPLAASAGPKLAVATFAAPTFVPAAETTHNNMGDSVCAAFMASNPVAENRGDLNAKTGSFLTNARLEDGARVQRLTMFANDNSAEDAFAFLVRKRIDRGLDPQFKGYRVMALARTNGAVNNVMRKFTDTSVRAAVIDNARFSYFIELVVCDAIEPFAVQVASR